MAAFVIPLVVIPIYIIEEPETINILATQNIGIENVDSKNQSFTLIDLVIYSYLSGVAIMLFKSVIEFASLYSILKDCKKEKINGFSILETNKEVSPFSFFNMIVYNPELFDKNELNHIIAHEKAHAGEWHSLDVILIHLATIILWFNPFVWLYKKDLKQNLEFIADRTAQNQSSCSKTYQRLLLKTSFINTQLILANNFYNSLIKKRIVMLHKNPSNKRNQWKLLLILPLLAAFLFTFNTKVIAQSKEKSKQENVEKIKAEVIEFLITKNSDDNYLEDLKSKLKEHGVTVSFKKIKRNTNNEITGISINASGKNSSANFSLNNDSPISDIGIKYDKSNDNLSIGNTKNIHFASGKNMTWVTKDSGDEEEIVIEVETDDSSENHYTFVTTDGKKHKINKKVKVVEIDGDDDEIIEIKKHKGNAYVIKKEIHEGEDGEKEIKVTVESEGKGQNVWISDEDDVHVIKSDKKKFVITENGESPLIFINGKESTKEAMEELDPNDIKSIEVLKGDKAVKEYGDKAKDGVIRIITK